MYNENLVYFIFCKLCKFYYVGLKGRSENIRIEEHIRDIKNLDLINSKITDVSQHFTQKKDLE